MSKCTLKPFIIACLITIQFIVNSVYAAEENPNSLADIWIVIPNAGQQEAFQTAFKKHLAFRVAKGDPQNWKTYVPIVGDNLNRYVVRFCCTKFNDIENYNKWESDNKVQDNWNQYVDQYVAKYEHYFSRVDAENSQWPKDSSHFKYFAVTHYNEKMGKGKSIETGKKLISDTAKAMNWPYSWSWGWQIGGRGGLTLVIPYKNYAGMTPPEKSFTKAMKEHLGDDAKVDKIFKQWASNFRSTSYTVYRLVDELSM